MTTTYELHPDGFLLESAPYGDGIFWRPDLPLLGRGATGEVAR